MASCKDCVYVEVCKEYVMGIAAVRDVDLNMDEILGVLQCDDCEHFKDRLGDLKRRITAEQAEKEREENA